MADKDEYYVVGPNGNRTTDDPGNAKTMWSFGGKDKTPTNWGDIAYTAGGGALGYALSKWLMGDDDDEDDGKGKKKGGMLRSLIPWLAAAAGAYGGHLLSGSALSEKGQKGEFAFKKNEDGTISVPGRPFGGDIPHVGGSVLRWTGGLTGAKGLAQAIRFAPERLARRNIANRFSNAPQKVIDELSKRISKMRASRSAFSGAHPRLSSFLGRLANPLFRSDTSLGFDRNTIDSFLRKGRLGRKLNGNIWSALAQFGLSGVADYLGYRMNSRRRAFDEAVRRAGLNPEDY